MILEWYYSILISHLLVLKSFAVIDLRQKLNWYLMDEKSTLEWPEKWLFLSCLKSRNSTILEYQTQDKKITMGLAFLYFSKRIIFKSTSYTSLFTWWVSSTTWTLEFRITAVVDLDKTFRKEKLSEIEWNRNQFGKYLLN